MRKEHNQRGGAEMSPATIRNSSKIKTSKSFANRSSTAMRTQRIPSRRSRVLAIGILLSFLPILIAACGSSATHSATSSSQSTSTAPLANRHAKSHRHTKHYILTGKVTAVGSTNLSILEKNGTTKSILLKPTTIYKRSGAKVGLSSLSSGERVRVRIVKGTLPDVAKVVTILPAS